MDDATREQLIGRSVGNEKTAGKMVFANDTLLDRRVHATELAAQGVIWKPLEAAMAEHADLFRKHFMAQEAILGSKKFAALHRAHVRTGTFLYVPKNVEVALPLETFHWLSGEGSSTFPHTLIIAEAGSKVTLVDYYESDRAEEPGFACAVNDLIVGPGAKVTYLCAQNWGEKVVSFQINSTTVERDAAALSLHLNLGASYARLESLSRLVGRGRPQRHARGDGRRRHAGVRPAHAAGPPGTAHHQRPALQKRARRHVEDDLRGPDPRRAEGAAHRRLPEGAQPHAQRRGGGRLHAGPGNPGRRGALHARRDRGHVDAEELFYLLARGIDNATAQELIVHGFLDEVLERLPDAKATPKLGVLLAEKFARMKRRSRVAV